MKRSLLAQSLLAFAFAFVFAFALPLPASQAAEFDITKFGATLGDATDDTLAIRSALEACGKAGGGTVLVPKGVFIVSRQKSEVPILSIPSKTTVRGDGDESVLKFDAKVNESNFWRMLGSTEDCADIIIRDLHLDGANTHTSYTRKTPEQNHGVFFYSKAGRIERVTVQDCLIENFSGDCVSFSQGCRGFVIKNIRVRNFLRQGIQMGGGVGDGGHLVTGCRDLEHTVKPGGSTIHVEHVEGGKGFRIEKNICHTSLLAGGGAEDLVVVDNEIHGRIEGNSIKNGVFENNRLNGKGGKRALMQFGYADGIVIRRNTIRCTEEATGIYVWGTSRYNPAPSKRVVIENNTLDLPGQPISLNGVEGGNVKGNKITGSKAANPVEMKRCTAVETAP